MAVEYSKDYVYFKHEVVFLCIDRRLARLPNVGRWGIWR